MGDQQGGFLAGLGGVREVGGQRGGCSWLSPEGLATAHGACLLQDFGMSGLRFGTLYTENRAVATAVASLCRYHGLSVWMWFGAFPGAFGLGRAPPISPRFLDCGSQRCTGQAWMKRRSVSCLLAHPETKPHRAGGAGQTSSGWTHPALPPRHAQQRVTTEALSESQLGPLHGVLTLLAW